MQNINSQNIIQLITQALRGQNNIERSNAELSLIHMRNNNTNQFFIVCAQLISDQNYDKFIRQSAGTVIGRLISEKNPNTNKYYWDDISPNFREQIKDIALGALGCQIPDVMRSAASVLAYILAIELPRNNLQEVIDVLAQNCGNQNPQYKNASITTIGYICEQIKNFNGTASFKVRTSMLGGIMFSLKDEDETIVITSLKALENCLSFLGSMMDEKQYRKTIFDYLIGQYQKQKCIRQTYYVMFEFVKAASKYLGEYKQAILSLSQAHLELRGEIAVWNLQLWQIIGTEYAQKLKQAVERIGQINKEDNFMQSVYKPILPCIMKCLLIENQRQEDDEFGLRQSAAKAISAFAECCNHEVIDLITNSVATLLSLDDPNKKQATVILFSCICDYQDYNYINQIFKNGFSHLFSLLLTNSQIIVKNSLNGFVRLSEVFPDVFLSHQNIASIIETIFNFLNVGPEHSQVLSHSSQILVNLSEGLSQTPDPVCKNPKILLQKVVQFYTQKWQQFHNNNQRQINQKLATIMLNIIMNTKQRITIVDLIDYMINQYGLVFKMNFSEKQIIIEQILSVLHTAILVHKNSVPNVQILEKICKLIDQHIKTFGVEHEGLSMLGATATTFGKMFEDRAKNYEQYVWQSLNMINDAATFKAGLSCFGDFARSLQSSFSNQAHKVMRELLKYINSSTIDRDLKVNILNCIGDMMMTLQQSGQQYLDEILPICDICFTAVYELSDFQSQFEYVQTLKGALIQMYSCIMFALNSSHRPNLKLYNHFGTLATFIVRSCDERFHPTVEYVKTCLFLIFDTAAFYWANPAFHEGIKQIVDSNQVNNLLMTASKFNQRQDIREMLEYISQRKRM